MRKSYLNHSHSPATAFRCTIPPLPVAQSSYINASWVHLYTWFSASVNKDLKWTCDVTLQGERRNQFLLLSIILMQFCGRQTGCLRETKQEVC